MDWWRISKLLLVFFFEQILNEIIGGGESQETKNKELTDKI